MNFQMMCRMMVSTLVMFTVFVVPLGMAHAQDMEAVERKLGEAVAEGDLTLEQALVMMEALKEYVDEEEMSVEERFSDWVEEVGDEIKAEMESGEISEKEAWEAWTEFKDEELAPKLKAAVKEGMISEAWAWEFWRGIEDVEYAAYLKDAVERGEMTEEEAWEKWEAYKDKREKGETSEKKDEDEGEDEEWDLVEMFEEIGVGEKQMGSIKKRLKELGVNRKKMDEALEVLIKLVHEMKEAGRGYEMSDAFEEYLEDELDLEDEAIEAMENLARRILRASKNDKR